jgi:ankyrin repeat protein
MYAAAVTLGKEVRGPLIGLSASHAACSWKHFMRSHLCWCSVAALFVVLAAAGCSGPPSRPSLDAEHTNAFELMTGAAKEYASGDIEEAGFLYYASRMRFKIDKQVYPPTAKGSDDPGVLMAALSSSLGQSIGPALDNDPAAEGKVAQRLAAWSPGFREGYDPGWEYQKAADAESAASVIATVKRATLPSLQAKAKLAESEEFVRAKRERAEAQAEMKSIDSLRTKQDGTLPEEARKKLKAANERLAGATKRLQEIQWEVNPESRWHARIGWKAEDYFQDQNVISLCQAIEANDVEKMEQLIAAGADANARGKDGMTPLLWAFPDRKLERFECLLRHGADPNVLIESNFGTPGRPFHPHFDGGSFFEDRGCRAGQAVIHLACQSPVLDYLKLVMAHGGDANLAEKETGRTPLSIVLNRGLSDAKERVTLLLASGADPNRYSRYHLAYPTMQAVNNGQYDVALGLLEAGADPKLYQPDGVRKLIHFVFRKQKDARHFSKQLASDFSALVEWLEQHGESLEQAKQDEERFARLFEKAVTPEQVGEVRRKIIAERNAAQNKPDAQGGR